MLLVRYRESRRVKVHSVRSHPTANTISNVNPPQSGHNLTSPTNTKYNIKLYYRRRGDTVRRIHTKPSSVICQLTIASVIDPNNNNTRKRKNTLPHRWPTKNVPPTPENTTICTTRDGPRKYPSTITNNTKTPNNTSDQTLMPPWTTTLCPTTWITNQ